MNTETTQLQILEQPAVVDKKAKKAQHYAYFLEELRFRLSRTEYHRLDINEAAYRSWISGTYAYMAVRVLRDALYLTERETGEKRFRLFKTSPSIDHVTGEWLYRQVQKRAMAINEKTRKKPTPTPDPVTEPEPPKTANYGLLWGDGSTDWFESMDAAEQKGYAEMYAMPDLKSVTIIQKVFRLQACVTVLAKQL